MFDKSVYIARRKVLASKISSGVVLMLGNSEAGCNYTGNTYMFRQDSTFLYYFGLDKPDLAAVIDIESGEEIIFGDDVDIDDIIWMGPQPLLKDEAAEVGVGKTAPLAKLEDYIKEAAAKGRKVHFIPQYRYHNMIQLNRMLGIPFEDMKKAPSLELILAVVSQRLIKEPCEIEEIEKACDLGYAMHYTAMKMMKPGMVEQELVGVMEGVCLSGGYMTSFATILSQHGETLHNHIHDGILTPGKLCVIDAGAESARITHPTSPVPFPWAASLPRSRKMSIRLWPRPTSTPLKMPVPASPIRMSTSGPPRLSSRALRTSVWFTAISKR